LERLAGEGFFQTTRQLKCPVKLTTPYLEWVNSLSSRFVKLICSMKNLEELNLFGCELAPVVLARVFQSCPKLIELNIGIHEYKTLQMDEHLKKRLKQGFQKLRRLRLDFFIHKDSWPLIQEMLT
jgi:hypothetical protein